MSRQIVLSQLGHTWILDIDGTIVKHNGYKIDGKDSFLPGVRKFLCSIPESDMIIFITSRSSEYKSITEKFLNENNIRYDYIIYNAPYGERILVNDNKVSGLEMSLSVCVDRNEGIDIEVQIDDSM